MMELFFRMLSKSFLSGESAARKKKNKKNKKNKKKKKKTGKRKKTLTNHLNYQGELWLDLGVTVSSQLQRKYKGLRRINQSL